jgi:hypothetical protein
MHNVEDFNTNYWGTHFNYTGWRPHHYSVLPIAVFKERLCTRWFPYQGPTVEATLEGLECFSYHDTNLSPDVGFMESLIQGLITRLPGWIDDALNYNLSPIIYERYPLLNELCDPVRPTLSE